MQIPGCIKNAVNHFAERNQKNWKTVYSNGSGVVQENIFSHKRVSYVTQPGLGSTAKYEGDCFTPKHQADEPIKYDIR